MPDRQRESPRVRLQIIRHLVFCRKGLPWARKWHSGQAVEAGGREQTERVPAVPPGISHTPVRIEDQERTLVLRKEVTDGQTCLACADHNGVDELSLSRSD